MFTISQIAPFLGFAEHLEDNLIMGVRGVSYVSCIDLTLPSFTVHAFQLLMTGHPTDDIAICCVLPPLIEVGVARERLPNEQMLVNFTSSVRTCKKIVLIDNVRTTCITISLLRLAP